jgi:hypothetical protein
MKEEPKQELPQFGTKEFNDLADVYFGGKPKQETLEELAKKTTKKYINEREKQTAYLEFIEGYKLAQEQAENKYSEEEVYALLLKYQNEYPYANNEIGLKYWFKQNDKK